MTGIWPEASEWSRNNRARPWSRDRGVAGPRLGIPESRNVVSPRRNSITALATRAPCSCLAHSSCESVGPLEASPPRPSKAGPEVTFETGIARVEQSPRDSHGHGVSAEHSGSLRGLFPARKPQSPSAALPSLLEGLNAGNHRWPASPTFALESSKGSYPQPVGNGHQTRSLGVFLAREKQQRALAQSIREETI